MYVSRTPRETKHENRNNHIKEILTKTHKVEKRKPKTEEWTDEKQGGKGRK